MSAHLPRAWGQSPRAGNVSPKLSSIRRGGVRRGEWVRTGGRRTTSLLAALCVVGALCVFPSAVSAASSTAGTSTFSGTSCSSSWVVTPSASATGAYNGVSAVTSQDVWSVGYRVAGNTTNPSTVGPLVTRWNGSKSIIVSTPKIDSQHAELNGVSMDSATDGWAVGFARTAGKTSQSYDTLAERWNGSSWTIASTPNAVTGGINELEAVKAFSSTDAWAVGFSAPVAEAPRTPVALYWNGSSWTSESVPAVGTYGTVLLGVAGDSPDDVWAVGYSWTSTYQDHPITEHWNGSDWTVEANGGTGTPAVLTAVSVSGPSDAWAVGYTDAFHPYAEHWNGTTWSASTPSSTDTVELLRGVVDESPTDAWAVGTAYVIGATPDQDQYEGVYAHWNGSQWNTGLLPVPAKSGTRIAKGLQMRGLSVAPGTPQLWAAGGIPGQQLLNLCNPSGPTTATVSTRPSAASPGGGSQGAGPGEIRNAASPSGVVGGRVLGMPIAPTGGRQAPAVTTPEQVYAVDEAGSSGIGQTTTGWTASVNDFSGDGFTSVFLMRGAKAASLYINDGTGTFSQVDEGEFPPADRWDCVSATVETGQLPAIYCAIGADHANGLKASQLYVRNSNGTYTNEAATFGVLDPTGRGRIGAFLSMGSGNLPALFVGQDPFRADGLPHTNHLYVNNGNGTFTDDPDAGLDLPYGSTCAIPGDYLGTGYDDLLLCTPTDGEHLYENNDGTFTDVTAEAGLPNVQAVDAAWGHFSPNGLLDLALVTPKELMVFLQQRDHTFKLSFSMKISDGTGVATGDVNDSGLDDIYVVTGGNKKANVPDLLLLNNGKGTRFHSMAIPEVTTGSGDNAYEINYAGNGLADFLVLNGIGEHVPEPLQLLTFYPDGPPQPPTKVSAVAGANEATVSFTAPLQYGGAPITGYTVTADDLTNSANGGQTATGAGSPIIVTGLTDGDTYTFTVTATNGNGTSARSKASNPVVPS
jgi:hypothetical protein